MKLKHTKGKFIIKKDNTVVSENNQGCLIAQICSANNNEEEQRANAKLIASAPQMLVDLITNYLLLLLMPSGFRNTPDGQILLSKALSSICNATGEAPQETQDFFEHISVSIKIGELDIPKAIKQITE